MPSVASAHSGGLDSLDPLYDAAVARTSFTACPHAWVRGEGPHPAQVRRRRLDRARVLRPLLSNAATPFIRALYRNYTQVIVSAPRAISASSAGRGHVNELLVLNYSNCAPKTLLDGS